MRVAEWTVQTEGLPLKPVKLGKYRKQCDKIWQTFASLAHH